MTTLEIIKHQAAQGHPVRSDRILAMIAVIEAADAMRDWTATKPGSGYRVSVYDAARSALDALGSK